MTRGQLPAILHLTCLGYQFWRSHSKEIEEWDRETNILVSTFKAQLLKLNYVTEVDFVREMENKGWNWIKMIWDVPFSIAFRARKTTLISIEKTRT